VYHFRPAIETLTSSVLHLARNLWYCFFVQSKPQSLDTFLAELASTRLPEPASRRGLRVGAGLSSRQLARAIGVSATTVGRWENGATPRRDHAIRYREILDALRTLR
jgi:DNA-binding transcriptional regulator YiaG